MGATSAKSPRVAQLWAGPGVVVALITVASAPLYVSGYFLGLWLLALGPLYVLFAIWLRWRRRHHYAISVIDDGEENAASHFATPVQVTLLLTRWLLVLCLASVALGLLLTPLISGSNAPQWAYTAVFCALLAYVPMPYLGLLAIGLGLVNALNVQQVQGEAWALGNHAGSFRRIALNRKLGAAVSFGYTLGVLGFAASYALTGSGFPILYPLGSGPFHS